MSLATDTAARYYAIVTHGRRGSAFVTFRSFYRSLPAALRHLSQAQSEPSWRSTAHIYECDTIALAKSADISEIRRGERRVYPVAK